MLQADELLRLRPARPSVLPYPPHVDEARQGSTPGDVWADLVAGVLDARSDEATRRFDAELSAAVADGSVSDEAARRLRVWQRASVRGVAEHVRTVLPVTLRALEKARQEDLEYAGERVLPLAPADDRVEPPPPDAPRVSSPQTRRASPATPGQPRTLDERRPRLLVADLTETQKDRNR